MFIICNKKKFPGFWLVQLDSRRRLWITTMPGSWNVKIPLFIKNNPKKYTEHFIRCVTPSTRTTATTTEDCGHSFDCDAAGNGYFADPFNCRKYWHCYRFCEHFSDFVDFLKLPEMALGSTFSAPTTLKLENQRFSISSTWAATFRYHKA